MVIKILIEKIKKELKDMWAAETSLPDYVPGGYAGKTIPKNKVSLFAFIALTLILAGIFWNAAANTDTVGLETGGSKNAILVNETWNKDDYTREHEATEVEQRFKGRVNSTSFELAWTDDDTSEANVGGIGVQNQPDRFRLTIVSPNGTEYSEEAESDINTEDGIITIDVLVGMTEKEKKKGRIEDFEVGDWNVTVECVEAGDSETTLGQVVAQDTGNDWILTVTYIYWKEASEGELTK